MMYESNLEIRRALQTESDDEEEQSDANLTKGMSEWAASDELGMKINRVCMHACKNTHTSTHEHTHKHTQRESVVYWYSFSNPRTTHTHAHTGMVDFVLPAMKKYRLSIRKPGFEPVYIDHHLQAATPSFIHTYLCPSLAPDQVRSFSHTVHVFAPSHNLSKCVNPCVCVRVCVYQVRVCACACG